MTAATEPTPEPTSGPTPTSPGLTALPPPSVAGAVPAHLAPPPPRPRLAVAPEGADDVAPAAVTAAVAPPLPPAPVAAAPAPSWQPAPPSPWDAPVAPAPAVAPPLPPPLDTPAAPMAAPVAPAPAVAPPLLPPPPTSPLAAPVGAGPASPVPAAAAFIAAPVPAPPPADVAPAPLPPPPFDAAPAPLAPPDMASPPVMAPPDMASPPVTAPPVASPFDVAPAPLQPADAPVATFPPPVHQPPAGPPPVVWQPSVEMLEVEAEHEREARAPHHTPLGDVVPAAREIGDTTGLADLDAREISAWFGDHLVLDRVSLLMPAGHVTALIGPSGCGKSTFLRILNRMHELIPGATMAGEVMLDGQDVYDPDRRLTEARRHIGMVFQKPNPFPAMSIYDNVLAGLRLTGTRASTSEKDDLVENCLIKAGLWKEVRDRLRQPGGALSGGQQQRLCIARSLAIKPRVLLMDEPCSALDPTSTRRIEETIMELVDEVTIVIVTHNMQQAARVSDQCAFFLAAQGTPGVIVEHGATDAMFNNPRDPRTGDYVNGRFG